MTIGIIAGSTRYYGHKDKFVSDSNLKGLVELLIQEHDVTLLTQVQEIEPFHKKLKYTPDSTEGEFDAIIMLNCFPERFINREFYRVAYTLLTHKAKKVIELLVDSNITSAYQFKLANSLNNTKYGELRDDAELRAKKYFELIQPFRTKKSEILTEWTLVYNCSQNVPNYFPVTLLDYERILSWKVELPKVRVEKNIYVGTYKPSRIKTLAELGIETDYFGDKCEIVNEKYKHINATGKILMSGLPGLYPNYQACILNTDKVHLKRGWILRRLAEAVSCGVPVLGCIGLVDSLYGFTNVSKHDWLYMTRYEIGREFDKCKDIGYRAELVNKQRSVVDEIVKDFNEQGLSKLTKLLYV